MGKDYDVESKIAQDLATSFCKIEVKNDIDSIFSDIKEGKLNMIFDNMFFQTLEEDIANSFFLIGHYVDHEKAINVFRKTVRKMIKKGSHSYAMTRFIIIRGMYSYRYNYRYVFDELFFAEKWYKDCLKFAEEIAPEVFGDLIPRDEFEEFWNDLNEEAKKKINERLFE